MAEHARASLEGRELPKILAFLKALVRKNPAAVAAGVNAAAALAAGFGLHLTAAELAVVVSVIMGALSVPVHRAYKRKAAR